MQATYEDYVLRVVLINDLVQVHCTVCSTVMCTDTYYKYDNTYVQMYCRIFLFFSPPVRILYCTIVVLYTCGCVPHADCRRASGKEYEYNVTRIVYAGS